MRKTLMMAALALATAGGIAAAQTPTPPPGGRGPGGRGGPGMMMDRMLLNGITLTDAQKAKLEALREADRQQMEENREQNQSEREAIRAAMEKGDSATARNLMAAERAKMEARRDRQITAIRALLTSEQYAAFDANVAALKEREANGPPMGRGRGPRPPQG